MRRPQSVQRKLFYRVTGDMGMAAEASARVVRASERQVSSQAAGPRLPQDPHETVKVVTIVIWRHKAAVFSYCGRCSINSLAHDKHFLPISEVHNVFLLYPLKTHYDHRSDKRESAILCRDGFGGCFRRIPASFCPMRGICPCRTSTPSDSSVSHSGLNGRH